MYWNTIKIPEPETNAVINYNMRCIETSDKTDEDYCTASDKLQHEMYWNHEPIDIPGYMQTDKLQHEMYWNG